MKEYAFPLSCGWDLVPGWDPGAPDAALSLPALERAGSAFWALGAFHLSSRPMLSSEGAERRGAHPLGPARYDAPPCRAGHGSPGALVLPLPQGQFPRNAVPCGAGMRPLSGGGARESLCLSRGGGMGDARGGAWDGERAGTSARPGSSAASQGFETLASGTERGGRGKVLLCGVKWRLSCRGAGARSLGASPGIMQAPGNAFLSVKTL